MTVKSLLLIFYSWLICSQLAAQINTEQLLLFVDSKNKILQTEDLAALEKLAQVNTVHLKIVDVQQGVPSEITFTPSIVFQNYLGRSFYYGRYKNLSRLQNFIRISRLAHQQDSENIKTDILVWKNGKSSITAPLKITELQGELPKDFASSTFLPMAKNATSKSMQQFKKQATYNSSRCTRSFYINLYPYVDAKKNLTISAELFSQYNCVEPIFQKYEQGLVSGKWKNRAALFAKAGQLMEAEILSQIESSAIGDAFSPLKTSISNKSWEVLQLQLPPKPMKNKIGTPQEFNAKQKWMVVPNENKNEPIVIFSFLPPVDNYAGEVKALSGTLDLGKEKQLLGAKGDFEVNIADVTMGAEDFDYEVQNKMLQKMKFPSSSFQFEITNVDKSNLELGQINQIMVKGKFTLLGKTIDLQMPAQIEPFVASDGNSILQVNLNFQLPLYHEFQVKGPDGPSPAKDTLQFFMKFHLL